MFLGETYIKMKSKKSSAFAIGIALFLLLIGFSLLFEDPSSDKYTYNDYKAVNDKDNSNIFSLRKSSNLKGDEIENLLYLEDKKIGDSNIVSRQYTNEEVGIVEDFVDLQYGGNFILRSNPLRRDEFYTEFSLPNSDELTDIYLYFEPISVGSSISDKIIEINLNDIKFVKTGIEQRSIPIRISIDDNLKQSDVIKVSISLENVPIFSIFNWNKVEFYQFKIIGRTQNKENVQKEFSQIVNLEDLDRATMSINILCDENLDAEDPLELYLNAQKVRSINLNCDTKKTDIFNIPLDYFSNDKNDFVFKTEGFYKINYLLNLEYLNDRTGYSFILDSFDDVYDVVLYGSFNRNVINLKINNNTMTMTNDEVISILRYVDIGRNSIKFLDDSLQIEELIIEKNKYLD